MAVREFFLGRQPIFDRQRQLVAYELLFRSADHQGQAVFTDQKQASASVIIDALSAFGFDTVLAGKKGFFNIDQEMLGSEALELLPRDQVVLEILEHVEPTPAVLLRLTELKRLGFTLALDDNVFDPACAPLYELVDIVKVDLPTCDWERLAADVAGLRQYGVELLAEKVETADEFARCQELGFDLYQGYYFARPVLLKEKQADLSRPTIMLLLNRIFADAPLEELGEIFKRDPNLTLALLRLVNSVAIGVRQRITSLKHAIAMLGQAQLRRWLLLAMFAGVDGALSTPLMEQAASRGKLMELIVAKRKDASAETADRAFIAGVLSCMAELLGMELSTLRSQLNLSEDIEAALAEHAGLIGASLELAERVAANDFAAVAAQVQALGLTPADLLEVEVAATAWGALLANGSSATPGVPESPESLGHRRGSLLAAVVASGLAELAAQRQPEA